MSGKINKTSKELLRAFDDVITHMQHIASCISEEYGDKPNCDQRRDLRELKIAIKVVQHEVGEMRYSWGCGDKIQLPKKRIKSFPFKTKSVRLDRAGE